MRMIVAFVLSAFFLSGCVTPMTKLEVDKAVYQPLPDSYKQDVQNIISMYLKDPYSAKFTFFTPIKSYSLPSRHFAYVVPVGVNAKNSYGGYTGYKMHYYAYYSGRFKDVTQGVNLGDVKWSDEVK
ncbi:hypothetical protein DCF79_11050 [Edwardsiella tarda]|uniref:hypothetical protein n=1 Tax=Edwardsiella tarda TaxID=636 RepID=UPI000D524D7C|nr:hypothetical protein [Edwardsiella tarda]UCQ16878.1 hypothetical protein DCF79_11050 [Edwardsiella tarda]